MEESIMLIERRIGSNGIEEVCFVQPTHSIHQWCNNPRNCEVRECITNKYHHDIEEQKRKEEKKAERELANNCINSKNILIFRKYAEGGFKHLRIWDKGGIVNLIYKFGEETLANAIFPHNGKKLNVVDFMLEMYCDDNNNTYFIELFVDVAYQNHLLKEFFSVSFNDHEHPNGARKITNRILCSYKRQTIFKGIYDDMMLNGIICICSSCIYKQNWEHDRRVEKITERSIFAFGMSVILCCVYYLFW